ncbi:MAG: hypothetical protein LBR61_06005 [Synergistaceae bacterium]|nr:hypothetical protein [Synergistaceae bacterium]
MTGYIYRRREWSKYCVVALVAGFALYVTLGFFLLEVLGESLAAEIRLRLVFAVCIILVALVTFGGTRIILTESELKVWAGFLFRRRTIRYDAIKSISRTRIGSERIFSGIAPTNRAFFFGRESLYATDSGPGFRIELKNGKSCVIQSHDREKILSEMKRVCPSLVIEADETN